MKKCVTAFVINISFFSVKIEMSLISNYSLHCPRDELSTLHNLQSMCLHNVLGTSKGGNSQIPGTEDVKKTRPQVRIL